MTTNSYTGGYIASTSNDYMTFFDDQSITLMGFEDPLTLSTNIITCARPIGAQEVDVCARGNQGGDDGQSNYEANPAIYAEDGSVKQADNMGELFTMFI